MKKIVKIIVIVMLTIVIFMGLYFYLTREKSVLFCYKNLEDNKNFNYYMSYEVFKGRNYVKLQQTNKLSISDDIYKQLLNKGFNDQMLEDYFKEILKVQLNSNFEDYGKNVKTKINSSPKNVNVKTIYKVDKKTKEKFENLFKFDFYNYNLEEIQKFYESGDMICERK